MTKIDLDDGQKMWIDYVNDVGKETADKQREAEVELCRNEILYDKASGNWYLRAWHVLPLDRMSGIRAEEMIRLSGTQPEDLLDGLYQRIARLMVMYKAGKVKVDG